MDEASRLIFEYRRETIIPAVALRLSANFAIIAAEVKLFLPPQ